MTSPHPGDTWRGVPTPADGRTDEQADDQPDDGQCAACRRGDHWACTDDGRRHSGRACECARSESGGHGPNGIGVI